MSDSDSALQPSAAAVMAARIEGLIPAISKSFVSSVLSIAIFGALLARHSPAGLAAWLALRVVASAGALIVLRRMAAGLPSKQNQPERTIKTLSLVMALSGVVWGLIPLLIQPSEPEWRAVVILWLFGNQSVVTAVCTPSRAVFRAAIASVTVVGAISSLAYGDSFGLVLAGILLLGGAYSTSIFSSMHTSVTSAIESRLLASSLAASLTTEQKKLEAVNEALTHLASRDELTSLLNRRSFAQHLVDADRNLLADGWLAYLDLDWFKTVNDSFGHAAGDHVLATAAKRWKDALPAQGVLARTGGDEFAAWFLAPSADAAQQIVSELRASLTAPIGLPDSPQMSVSCSIGVTAAQRGEPFASAAARADQALYAVKDQGRDGIKMWTDGHHVGHA